MSISIIQESEFLLHSLILGVIITFAYDWLRIFRRVVKHADFFVSLEDFCYWILCSIAVFSMLYNENNGMLRWFAVIGAAIGMFLYKLTISRFFVKYMAKFLNFINKILGKCFKVVMKPFIAAGKFGCNSSKKGARKGKKLARILKNKLTHTLKLVKIMLCKQ